PYPVLRKRCRCLALRKAAGLSRKPPRRHGRTSNPLHHGLRGGAAVCTSRAAGPAVAPGRQLPAWGVELRCRSPRGWRDLVAVCSARAGRGDGATAASLVFGRLLRAVLRRAKRLHPARAGLRRHTRGRRPRAPEPGTRCLSLAELRRSPARAALRRAARTLCPCPARIRRAATAGVAAPAAAQWQLTFAQRSSRCASSCSVAASARATSAPVRIRLTL